MSDTHKKKFRWPRIALAARVNEENGITMRIEITPPSRPGRTYKITIAPPRSARPSPIGNNR